MRNNARFFSSQQRLSQKNNARLRRSIRRIISPSFLPRLLPALRFSSPTQNNDLNSFKIFKITLKLPRTKPRSRRGLRTWRRLLSGWKQGPSIEGPWLEAATHRLKNRYKDISTTYLKAVFEYLVSSQAIAAKLLQQSHSAGDQNLLSDRGGDLVIILGLSQVKCSHFSLVKLLKTAFKVSIPAFSPPRLLLSQALSQGRLFLSLAKFWTASIVKMDILIVK